MDAFSTARNDFLAMYIGNLTAALFGTPKTEPPSWRPIQEFQECPSFILRISQLKEEWPSLKEEYLADIDEWKNWIRFCSDPTSTYDYEVREDMICDENRFFQELACLEANSTDIALILNRLVLIRAYVNKQPFLRENAFN